MKLRDKPPGKKPARTPRGASPKTSGVTRLRKPRTQYAVLPWRPAADGGIEILLITSRETSRWVIPKGWPMKSLAPYEAAAREAYEEAGIEGYTPRLPYGAFGYEKRLPSGKRQRVAVELFSMQVALEHAQWPEMKQRQRRWTTPAEAAELVEEPELKALILGFVPPRALGRRADDGDGGSRVGE